MKNNTKKSKIVLFSLLGVGVLSLTGVGVASWIIATQNGATTGNVNVSVGTITDNRINITNPNLTDDTIKFDAKSGDDQGPITAGSGSSEDLVFAFTFGVTGISHMSSFSLSYSSGSETDNGYTALSGAVTNNYLVSPIDTASSGTSLTTTTQTVNTKFSDTDALKAELTAVDTNANTGTVTVTCTFAWGSFFGSKNPCEIASDASEDTITSYKTGLTSLRDLNSKKLYVVITPSAEA
jgi:hypothetical protein